MPRMYEQFLTTDRWPNRAISPVPFDASLENLPVVLVHPGWGKRPEMHSDLLHELTNEGFRAIGLDTRYGYANQGLSTSAQLKDRTATGSKNPFFDGLDTTQNRYFYRRPTGLLQACVDLEIEPFAFVGHSEGGRIGLVATSADHSPLQTRRMILVNSVGTGEASGLVGMARANIQAIRDRRESEASFREALKSFRDSAVHFITHPRRTSREAEVIHQYDAWPDIGRLALTLDEVVVMNARDDELIEFKSADVRSLRHPEAKFVATEGSHSNIYDPHIRNLIVSELTK